MVSDYVHKNSLDHVPYEKAPCQHRPEKVNGGKAQHWEYN